MFCRLFLVSVVAGWSLMISSLSFAQAQAPGNRIVFLGDSITQAGNRAGGYVDLVRTAFKELDAKTEIISAGISGNKVPDLLARLERDVLSKKPTKVVIYIGINDVWHSQNGKGTSQEDYHDGLIELIDRIRQAGSEVVLCTPSVIGEKTDGSNPLDAMLEEYCAISREVATAKQVQLLDLRKQFLQHLEQANPDNLPKGILTGDGVHLNADGNQFVASQMLSAFNMDRQQKNDSQIRHIVLFKFVDGLEPAKIKEVVDAFGQLPKQIDTITDFEMGTNISPENLDQGFTHCFVVTFANTADRDAYLPHPAHQEFVKLLDGRIDKVLVFDFKN